MENLKMEDLIEADATSVSETDTVTEENTEETQQDLLKVELDRVQKSGRTELEKAQFSLKKNAERLIELGGDPQSILGVEKAQQQDDDEDNKPITRGELKKIIASNASKTALQLADEIQDSTEKELVKYYLENRIASSGNPHDDLRDARRIVNSLKNEQIAQELARKTAAKTHSNASSGPAKPIQQEAELSADELMFMKSPFNMSKEQIIKARKG